jgi:5'-methylthioadenosine phosphorylase
MEGPTFSTRAESNAHRQLGFDVIGMTNLGEARCAREAEIHYATMAMITDYDCWKTDEAHVTVEMVIANLMKNADAAKKIVKLAIPRIPATTTCGCDSALKNAIMTDKKLWPAATKKRLAAVVQKYK